MSTIENFQSFIFRCRDRVANLHNLILDDIDTSKVLPPSYYPESQFDIMRALNLSVLEEMYDDYFVLCNWYGEHRTAGLVMFMKNGKAKLQFCQIDY